MQDFEQDFDPSWEPPTNPREDYDSSWKPPTRRIRGPSGLGEEVEGKLPPLASEKEEFPFTGPMPFSLRENAFRGAQNIKPGGAPILPEGLQEYFGGGPLDPGASQTSKVGSVLDFGSRLIHGQQKDSAGRPLVGSITAEDQSVLPKSTSEPDTWLGGFGKGLYNEFGRHILNPDTILGSMEPGPAGAKSALGDFLKVGESPIGKLVSKVKTAKLPQTKTPEDVAALEAQLKGTLAEPFRPGALETGPIASIPPIDLSTGIPKPRIDAATFAQMRDARAMEASRAEAAANAARVAPDPPTPEASIATRPLAGMNPQAARPNPALDPLREYHQLRRDAIAAGKTPPTYEEWSGNVGKTTITPSMEAAAEPAPKWAAPRPETPAPISTMPAPSRIEEAIPEIPPEIPPVEAMPEIAPESQALEGEVIDPRVSPLTNTSPTIGIDYKGERRISPGTQEEYHFLNNLQNHISGAEPYAPELDIHAPENQWLLEKFFGKGAVIPEFGVGKEAALRGQLDMAAEIRKASAAPRELPPITAERDLVESPIEEAPPISSMPESQEPPLAVPEAEILPETPIAEAPIESTPEESPWVGEEIVEEPPVSIEEAFDNALGNESDTAISKGFKGEEIENAKWRGLIRGADYYADTYHIDPDAFRSYIMEKIGARNWDEVLRTAAEEAPKPKTKAELKAERIAAKKEKVASKWAGISKPSEGPAKMLTKGEVPAIESMPRETPSAPKPTKITPIEEMPIGSLPGEEGITEGIITSQDKADFRAREEEMKKALEGKTRASETGALEDRPSNISEFGEEIVPPEEAATLKAKAEEMKRALEGKKRAGSKMSMPEMGRGGELPKETPKPKGPPKPPTTSERWQSQVDALDKAKAPDSEYQSILSTGSKTPLRKKETWRERVMGYIDLQRANEAKPKGGTTISSLGAGQGGDILRIAKETAEEIGDVFKKGIGSPPVAPPEFSWRSKGSTTGAKSTSSGIGSKGPLDVLKESKFGKAVSKAYSESEFESPVTRALDVAGNTMKSLMSTGDLSGALRQGGALVHKKEWREAVPKMIEMFKDEAVFTKRMNNIKKDPLFKFANDSGLSMTGLNAGKEERFASDIGHSIPGFGKLSKASDNAFTGFQNELRFSTFKTLLQDATNAGLKPGRDKELAKEIASFVNEATGRGSLGKLGEPMARLANSVIYSPRLGMSRIQMIRRINPLDPKFYSQGKFVRKEAIKSAFALAGMNLAANAATAAVGGTVTYNILNSDFMKNKFGNTRVDMGAGFLQPVVLAARIATEKYTSSTSGKTYELGTDYGQTSTGDLLWRFLQSKEAPIAGLVAELYSGKDWQGQDKSRAIAAAERFTPLILQDMYDIVKEDPRMAPLIVPGFFGGSVQTYGKPEKKQKLSMPKMGL